MRRMVVVLASLVAGCGGAGSPATDAGGTPAASPTPDPGRAVACEQYQPDPALKRPRGLLGPSEAMVAAVQAGRPTTVEGFVAMTPDEFLAEVTGSRYEILFTETEGFESEALLTDGRFQTFWKVFERCEGGSQFLAVIDRSADVRP